VAGTDVPITESSGTVSFDLEGLTVIEFESGEAALQGHELTGL
jgi:hypothetical protein